MAEQSSIGNHLAELYDSIHKHQKLVEEAEENVKTAKRNLQKQREKFAKYLTDNKIHELIFPAQDAKPEATEEKPSDGNPRKERIKPNVLKATIARNRLIYNSENYQPLGVNKLGEPVKYKGNSSKNAEVNKRKEQDIQRYEDQYGPITDITLESLEGEHKFLLGLQVETISKGEGDEATASKATSKSKSKVNTEAVGA
jgi:hypothetical protein